MARYMQDPPYKIELDVVNGCFVGCDFCALHGCKKRLVNGYDVTTDNLKYMKMSVVTKVADEVNRLGWKSRIIICGHGEPMLHPRIMQIVRGIRELCPNPITLVSNGYDLCPSKVDELFYNGLTNLSLSEYEDYKKAAKLKVKLRNAGYDVADWEDDDEVTHVANLKSRITVCAPFEKEEPGSTHKIVNRCGVSTPPSTKQIEKRCAKPFRDMFVRWNGQLAICCNDFRGYFDLPDVRELPLDMCWNARGLDAVRRVLYHKGRHFFPCAICDYPAYRVGLLPDSRGKKEMPRPSAIHYDRLRNSIAERPVNGYVPRPWEPKTYQELLENYLEGIELCLEDTYD